LKSIVALTNVRWPRNGLLPLHSTLLRRSLLAKRHTVLRYRHPCSFICPIRGVRIALRRFAPNSESFKVRFVNAFCVEIFPNWSKNVANVVKM